MGDVLHAMPAAAALRRSVPGLYLGWVIERRWLPLLAAAGESLCGARSSARPLVECVHVVDTLAWRLAPLSGTSLRAAWLAIRELRESGYGMAIDLQGSLKSAVVAALSAAPRRLGFSRPREAPAGLAYTRRIEAQGVHIIEQNLSLCAPLTRGIRRQAPAFDLPFDAAAERECQAELSRRGVGEFVILAPGAGWQGKQWPPESYAEVARALRGLGLACLVTFGPGEEALAQAVAEHSRGAAVAFPCSISGLIALTRRARLFIGGDTGPMHLAAALHVPVVAIFGPTDPARNGPFATAAVVLRDPGSTTSYSHSKRADAGLSAIGAAEVVAAAEQLLGAERV
jgi:heptosyltransferase-1